jgi:hypothetical protein
MQPNPRRRHSGGNNGGHHRRNNNNNNNNNRRFSGPPRPGKNYRALQEKYLNMARDAMASGDRILAEYYYQHADHYFRMQQEFMAEKSSWQEQNPGVASAEDFPAEAGEASTSGDSSPDVDIPNNSSVLPAFLHRKVEVKSTDTPAAPAEDNQGWEEQA